MDTGSATPLVVKKGIVPKDMLMQSAWPVTFVTVDGTVMKGGSAGLRLSLSMVVEQSHDHARSEEVSTHVLAVCDPLWAYEAEIHSMDLIIGYPFLQGYGLAVDAAANS